MRKFFATLIVLLIAGGTAFFFGWAQLAVPPGSWGVMRSKTHGLDRELIREGELRWVWYKLIPTNVEILVFSPRTISRTLTWRGELPSGDVYAGLAGIGADFSWELSGELSFNIKPASLPDLVEKRNIGNQEEFDAFSGELADEIGAFAQGKLLSYAEKGEQAGEFPFSSENATGIFGFPEELQREIYGAFPEIENLSGRIRPLKFPDLALYRSARQIYEEYLQKQREFLSSGMNRAAESRLNSQMRFDELEKYGALLTKYPILLRYLALESGSAASPFAGESPGGALAGD